MQADQQQALVERLYENESLTDNLDDADAKALLQWAEQQIRSDTDGTLVTAAVSFANQSGTAGVQALLLQADTFLAQEISARAANAAPPAPTQTETQEANRQAPRESETNTMSASGAASMQISAQISDGLVLGAHADAAVAPDTSAPKTTSKKSKRSRRKK